MYKRKGKYYKVINVNTNCKAYLMKEYKKLLWFYVPYKNKRAFWINQFELKKYEKI